ncbi:MAG: PorT family protein [Bacteroidales bacterium]|nr:PorT family protein [Bacteroidales bacterium]MBD5229801.1 PorT family protein [Bacteroidales bacterium]MBD5258584.1 PorT family protein [Barnesiella sp.]
MKKILLLAVAIVAMMLPVAANAQFRYGATAGVDFSTLKFKQDLFTIDASTGFQAGVQGELMFPGIGFGVDIAMLYNQRGATLHLGEREVWASQGYTDPRCYLHYVEIPVNLRFKWTRMQGLEDYIAPYVFGGPSISFLAGHSKIEALQYAFGEIGLQCGLGFEIMRRWQIQGSYTWGMTYALKTRLLDDFSAQNRTWSIRATYFF